MKGVLPFSQVWPVPPCISQPTACAPLGGDLVKLYLLGGTKKNTVPLSAPGADAECIWPCVQTQKLDKLCCKMCASGFVFMYKVTLHNAREPSVTGKMLPFVN